MCDRLQVYQQFNLMGVIYSANMANMINNRNNNIIINAQLTRAETFQKLTYVYSSKNEVLIKTVPLLEYGVRRFESFDVVRRQRVEKIFIVR